MRKQDPKAFPDPENTRAIVSGFGTQRSKPDSGTVPPVEPAPEARAVKRGGRERKRHESVTRRKVNKYRQLYQRLGKRLEPLFR